ncbi:apolipoprotein N-acyltransferase [Alphaproteobacteria bacterium]|nr:apolipoprotein N-acyltransferase [Alphaproteobacteria bacterium]
MIFFILFFLCGILVSLLYPPFFLTPIGFFVFPLLFYLLNHKNYITLSYKKFFFSGFSFGLGFFIIYLGWIKEPFFIEDITKKYFIFSYLLIIYCALYYGIIFFIISLFKTKIFKLFALPVLIVLAEFISNNFIYGFPWLSFSLVHSNNIIGSSLIYFSGTYFTSYITVLIFLFFSIFFIENLKFRKVLRFLYLFIFLLIITLSSTRYYDSKFSKYDSIDISIIQSNFHINQYLDQNEKLKKQKFILDLIKKNKSEIILFGENDYPFLMNLNDINLIQTHIQNNQSVIIGSIRKEDKNYFNSIFLIRKNEYSYFDKQILVPFGEFVPLRNLFGFMEYISGSLDFTEGTMERNLQLNNIKILPVICYEILFFWKLLHKSNINSDIIVNITNDSWFGDFSGPYQHFYFAKLRAAEFNKTLIRVSVNGISAGIDNFGRIIKFSKLNQQQNKIISIPINNSNIQYIRFHKIIFFLIFIPLLVVLFINKKNV